MARQAALDPPPSLLGLIQSSQTFCLVMATGLISGSTAAGTGGPGERPGPHYRRSRGLERPSISPDRACLVVDGGCWRAGHGHDPKLTGTSPADQATGRRKGRDRPQPAPQARVPASLNRTGPEEKREEETMPHAGVKPQPVIHPAEGCSAGSIAPVRRGHPPDPGRADARPPGHPGRLFVAGERFPSWLVRSWVVCGSLLMIAGARLPTPWSLARGTDAVVRGWSASWRAPSRSVPGGAQWRGWAIAESAPDTPEHSR
jgi:hypothetical protein